MTTLGFVLAAIAAGCGGSGEQRADDQSGTGGDTSSGSGGKVGGGKGGSGGKGSGTGGTVAAGGNGGDVGSGGTSSGGTSSGGTSAGGSGSGGSGTGGDLGTGGATVDAAEADQAEPADAEAPDMQTPDAAPPLPLPMPWVAKDVGSVGALAGWLNVTTPINDVQKIQVYGGGATGIGGTADAFHFAYDTIAGDAEILGRITNLTMLDPNVTIDPSTAAGLMIRDSLDPGAAMVFVGPVGDGKTGGRIIVRTAKGQAAVPQPEVAAAPRADIKAGQWIRLVRQGATVQIFVGTRLQIWNGAGAAGMPTLTLTAKAGAPLYYGLAATSNNAMSVVNARFEDIMINNLGTNPVTAGWSTQAFGIAGGSVLWGALGELAITGFGNPWNLDPMKSRDTFQYAFFQPSTAPQTSNASLRFLVADQGMTDPGGRVVAMYRLPTGSDITKFTRGNSTVALSLTQGQGIELNVRTSDGEKNALATPLTMAGLKAPLWLRIDRLMATETGDPLKNQFTEVRAYYAAYSKTKPATPGAWIPFGEPVIFRSTGPADFASLGIGVGSYAAAVPNTAHVTNLTVTTAPAPPPVGFDGGVPDTSSAEVDGGADAGADAASD